MWEALGKRTSLIRVTLLKPSGDCRKRVMLCSRAKTIQNTANYASKVVMQYGIARLVTEAVMSTMLFEMSADGTPTVVFKHLSSQMPPDSVVHRKAKQTCTLPDGRAETRVVVHDPVLLKHGKGAHAIVEVLRKDGKTGRQLGCGVCIGIVQVRSVCAVSLGAHLAAGACCRRAVP